MFTFWPANHQIKSYGSNAPLTSRSKHALHDIANVGGKTAGLFD